MNWKEKIEKRLNDIEGKLTAANISSEYVSVINPDDLKTILNVSEHLGVSAQKIIDVWSRVKLNGFVEYQDMRNLCELGFPVIELIDKSFTNNVPYGVIGAIKNGEVLFTTLRKILLDFEKQIMADPNKWLGVDKAYKERIDELEKENKNLNIKVDLLQTMLKVEKIENNRLVKSECDKAYNQAIDDVLYKIKDNGFKYVMLSKDDILTLKKK